MTHADKGPETLPTTITTTPLLEVKGLTKHFPIRGGIWRRQVAKVHAVDNISFSINAGETLGLVGESGCGKSTVGKTLLCLLKHDQGEIWFDQQPLHQLSAKAIKPLRQDIQIIFQDPMESLNPRHTVGDIIEEALIIHGLGTATARRQAVRQLIDRVGLSSNAEHRYPHEFSGGQRQRIGIARAIALKPRLIICDEPVSALDVSIQSQILNLLIELQAELGSAMLFISHDLGVVKHLSHRIAVMYLGQIVEIADAQTLYQRPAHPYTKALLASIPRPDPSTPSARQLLDGEPPSPVNPPAGCRFHTRCPMAKAHCRAVAPTLQAIGSQHQVSCHFWDE